MVFDVSITGWGLLGNDNSSFDYWHDCLMENKPDRCKNGIESAKTL